MSETTAVDPSKVLADESALRERYRPPHPAIVDKALPQVDPVAARFIELTPLIVVATSSSSGADASPRGGPAGFVKVLDEHHVAFADLAGNNRLDSYSNIVENPRVGILFLLPGSGETLRVNGRASVTTDPAVLDATAIDGVTPKVAIVVAVEECYIHCAKAIRRSGVWDPTTWQPQDVRPTAGEVIADQYNLDVDPGLIDADLESGYQETMWQEGGV